MEEDTPIKHELLCFYLSAVFGADLVLKKEKPFLTVLKTVCFAEREGFEPSIQSSRIQSFQDCSFDHSDTFPCFSAQM
ncbi:hypothetical protein SPHINGO8BC_60584 [Sphingobacterium multivorum]|uniref:Uncharacterized protein n=1 Tax=Sphingobacterium multivorum TaxID=28454 RepID=A0A654DJW2_SPHMU|nr:hypothetical protein SPHINGO8BC_60584 [Sphingobacterium multivorum]